MTTNPASLPVLDLQGNTLFIRGEVNYYNVLPLVKAGESLFQNVADLCVDLADLIAHDSAWLSLLLVWYRARQFDKKTFRCIIHSPRLIQTMTVYDLISVIPFEKS